MNYRMKSLEILQNIEIKKAIPKELLSSEIKDSIENSDRIFRIVNGVLENRILLDEIISNYSKMKISKSESPITFFNIFGYTLG